MKNNQSRLIKLLIALIAVFIILAVKNESSSWRTKFFPQKSNQPFLTIKKDQINEVILTKDKTSKVYKKKNDWIVKNNNSEFRADKEKINKIIEGFINLKKESIVSSNKNKHKELGIDKQKIEVKASGKTYTVYLGNTSGLSNNYVRINKENDVFIAGGFEEAFVSEDYRDLSVPLVNDEIKVTSIEIDSEHERIFLIKEKSDWKIADKTAKKDRVEFYLNDLKSLQAKDVLKKQENYPAVNPELSITLEEDNKKKTIGFYLPDEENYSARVTSSNFDYIIPAAYVASLKKEEKDFLE